VELLWLRFIKTRYIISLRDLYLYNLCQEGYWYEFHWSYVSWHKINDIRIATFLGGNCTDTNFPMEIVCFSSSLTNPTQVECEVDCPKQNRVNMKRSFMWWHVQFTESLFVKSLLLLFFHRGVLNLQICRYLVPLNSSYYLLVITYYDASVCLHIN